ncbi:hypothetical protein D3273_25815 [Lichenibacterium minor]|uniref:Uncharacterized protein n=1 Tax=Lichenibacterium minor TaxID=2316528 RepID=A0A4Q2U317_9HYPH|nr:hypothetical protein [Lichenibacterium minor]RYC29096.1 hypothetical protein D3273_25815 [Lichenibacterium minor]
MHRGAEAVGRVGLSPAADEEAEAAPVTVPGIVTARPRAPASDTSAVEPRERPTVVASAVPTPREIFDFHPAGSAAGTFRQPFIIDPNDGPLTADVRRTAAELKEFNAAMKSGTALASNKRCGEMDIAQAKPGCAGQKSKVASIVSSDPLALH